MDEPLMSARSLAERFSARVAAARVPVPARPLDLGADTRAPLTCALHFLPLPRPILSFMVVN